MWAGGARTAGDTAIDSWQLQSETLKVTGLESMHNCVSNGTPAFLLASEGRLTYD